jgi:hypothetical protein
MGSVLRKANSYRRTSLWMVRCNGLVKLKTGKTLWYLILRVNNKWLSLVYEAFAEDVGLTKEKIVLLVEDNPGRHHTKKVKVER